MDLTDTTYPKCRFDATTTVKGKRISLSITTLIDDLEVARSHAARLADEIAKDVYRRIGT